MSGFAVAKAHQRLVGEIYTDVALRKEIDKLADIISRVKADPSS